MSAGSVNPSAQETATSKRGLDLESLLTDSHD
jgi:hypothetical protein